MIPLSLINIKLRIINYNSDKALDVLNGYPYNFANVIQSDIFNEPSQMWMLKRVDSFFALINSNGKALDVQMSTKFNGSNACIYDYHGGTEQLWDIQFIGNGLYAIQSVHNGKCLDVRKAYPYDGANVQMWDWHNGSHQKWSIAPV